jgi:hypothetical protein
MIIVRTHGEGTCYENERLQNIQKMIEHYYKYHPQRHRIFKLHDHKGKLSVYWFSAPTEDDVEFLNDSWKYLNEYSIEHYVVFISERRIVV